MKLPNFLRLNRNDYKDENKDFAESLAGSLNPSIESLYAALSKRLTVSDNFLGTEVDIVVDLNSDGTPKNTTSFSLDFIGKAKRVVIGKAENVTNSNTYPTGAPFISFSQIGSNVVINHITGLQSNNKWRLSVTAYG